MSKKQVPEPTSSKTSTPEEPYLCEVALPLPLNQTFSYICEKPLEPGTLVSVPFRKKSLMGVVWPKSHQSMRNDKNDHKQYNLKCVEKIYPLPILPKGFTDFIGWVSKYTMAPLGNVLKLGLSVQFTDKQLLQPLPSGTSSVPQAIKLTPSQKKVWGTLKTLVETPKKKPILLQGLTGSGKTEVYFKAIELILKQNGSCLILQPEINLTHDWQSRFEKHFGFKAILWHSNTTPKQRREAWRQILEGRSKVVIGARSALFLPFIKLDLLIVDEEHDMSYKQEEQTLYNARDMAVVRSSIEKCALILVSATPSLETQANVEQGKYESVRLKERYGQGGLPTVQIQDVRESSSELRKLSVKHKRTFYITPLSQALIRDTLDKNEQVLIFLNRRGYAPLTLCRHCGHRIQCPNCTAWMVDHRPTQGKRSLSCHHCGHTTIYPDACPECEQENSLAPCGPGVERLEEEVGILFPQATTAIMTSETLATPKVSQEALDKIFNGHVDIVIGTQVMAKGHTFPKLTLTVVIDADLGLNTIDLRASEKTFQLLHQVGGRAGRCDTPGNVILQTFDPSHPVIQALSNYDDDAFYKLEKNKRLAHTLPPFGRMAALTISSSKEQDARQVCKSLYNNLPSYDEKKLQILGPAPASMAKRKRQFRWRYLLKSLDNKPLQNFIKSWIQDTPIPHTTKLTLDIDPLTFT